MAVSMESRGNRDAAENEGLRLFLSRLPFEVQETLSRNTREVRYRKGSNVRLVAARLRPGVVVEGLIRAYVATRSGREVTVGYARPGHPVGILSRFMSESPLGLAAVEDTTVVYFDARRFDKAIATDVTLTHRVAGWMADDIVGTANTLLSFAFGSVRSRLAVHLLAIASSTGGGPLTARVTQQELADAIGSARQVVARALSDLASDGLICTARGAVTITNEADLRREATPV
jgi:CRP/FNR family cyclic AMP-dependent transcriptional regulator